MIEDAKESSLCNYSLIRKLRSTCLKAVTFLFYFFAICCPIISPVRQETKRQEQSERVTRWNLDLASVWKLPRPALEQAWSYTDTCIQIRVTPKFM